ncbi:MAG: class I SAM-dependent methyltransferase [Ilumatobacteraceae bacterium]
MSRDWHLDERAHAGPEHLDEGYVSGYERKAGFDPTEDVELLRVHGLRRDSTVVDVGAGTGVFAAAIAAHCGRVVAVDVSPAMLAALRARAEVVTNLEVVEAGFLTYEHAGGPADVVYTRHALHQLPDFWKAVALARITAMLRPGGLLRLRDLVYDFDPGAVSERVEHWLGGATSDPSAGWTAAELATHVRDEHSTFSWLLEAMLERTGYEILDRSTSRGLYAAYTCRRRA